MQSKTHLSFALSVATIPFFIEPSWIISIELIPYFLGGISLGALFPDIDEPNSSIGRKTIVVSHLLNYIFGHRGFTHKFIFFLTPLLFTIIFEDLINNQLIFIFLISFSFGILLHQIGDMFSGSKYYKGGIKDYFFPFVFNGSYFTPFPKILRCAVGDYKEQIYNFAFTSLFIYEVYHIITTTDLTRF